MPGFCPGRIRHPAVKPLSKNARPLLRSLSQRDQERPATIRETIPSYPLTVLSCSVFCVSFIDYHPLLQNLVNDGFGAFVHLVENAPQVLADHAQHAHL